MLKVYTAVCQAMGDENIEKLVGSTKNLMIDNHMTIKVKIVLVKSTRLKRLGAMMIPFCRNR